MPRSTERARTGSASPLRRFAGLIACWALARSAPAHPALDAQVADLSRRVALRPGDASVLLQRAEVRREHGQLELARQDLEAALEAGPSLAAAHAALARLELEAGRPEEALRAAETFLSLMPGHPDGLLSRARSLAAVHGSSASEAWTQALDALETSGRPQPEIYFEAADVLGAGAIDRGVARLGAVPTLLARGIEIERRAGRTDEALRRCRVAAGLAPSPEWSVVEGEILAEASRGDEALAAFARAIAQLDALPSRTGATRFMRDLRARASCRWSP